ncbi:MAG: recombinase family protein [Rickettsia endosymbiont of Bryobia graminum]|nr:recombinase family protein [Rickettsia endosymbiont of Bryobia graminum]
MTKNFRVYGYLRASTKEQDAARAKDALLQFANNSNLTVASFFIEYESGAKLDRPELFRLLDIAQPNDIILVEQIDRISRLNDIDWNKLKTIIKSKQLKIVSLDLPTSHQFVENNDEFTNRMLTAINDLMLDMLAAVARKDYQDRRRRQKEGISKAKTYGLYKGRRENTQLHSNIKLLLSENKSYNMIISLLNCSRGTIAKVAKRQS